MFVSSCGREASRSFLAVQLLLPLMLSGLADASAATDKLRTVILSSPDLVFEPGGTNTPFLGPSLNSHGQTAFTQLLPDRRVFSEAAGRGLEAIATEGELAPGVGLEFKYFDLDPRISDNGQTVFTGKFSADGVSSADEPDGLAIFVAGRGAEPQLIARGGDQAPGAEDGVLFWDLQTPTISSRGEVVFTPRLSDADGVSRGYSIFRETRGEGLTQISQFANRTFFPSVNDNGQVVFFGGSRDEDDVFQGGLILDGELGQEELVSIGDPAPVAEQDTTFVGGDQEHVNNRGEAVFRGILVGPADQGAKSGLFSQTEEGGLRLIARQGETVPGTDFHDVETSNSWPQIDDSGRAAFIARNDDESALVRENLDGNFEIIARTGGPAPGTLRKYAHITQFQMNARGQVSFIAGLERGGGAALFAEDIEGNLEMVAGRVNKIDVSDDPATTDLRSISNILTNYAMNDAGQIAFTASFSDRSFGVFVSDLVAVPEPTCIALCCIGAALLTIGRVHRFPMP